MKCRHHIGRDACTVCANEPLPSGSHRPFPSVAEQPADRAGVCARSTDHLIAPGEPARYVDLVGWCCIQCALPPVNPIAPPAVSPLGVGVAPTPNKPPGSRTTTVIVTSLVVVVALLVVGFIAVSFLSASADAKFDEVGRAIEADNPSGAGPSGPSTAYDEPIERDEPIEGASKLNPMRIGPTQFPAWPFTIESGILSCEPVPDAEQFSDNQVLANITLRTDDGTVYAINGTARGRMEARGWHDVHDIWASGDLGPIIDLGHAIC